MPEGPRSRCEVRCLGTVSYAEALVRQESAVRARRDGRIPDQLLLLEHPPVITLGSAYQEGHILLGAEELHRRGIEVHRVGRGGDVTLHAPGQLVGYPILALPPERRDLHRYLRDLEEALLGALAGLGVQGHREKGLTGVWTEQGKVAAIGIRVSSGWVTSHGFALNVRNDLTLFDTIVPCGIEGRPVTSLARILERDVGLGEVVPHLLDAFESVFGLDCDVVGTTFLTSE